MDNLLEFFKVVSDEMRFRILLLLGKRDLCVCQICEILGLSQPKVSQHLGKLRDLGLVQDNRQGKWVFYRLTIDDAVISRLINTVMENVGLYPALERDREMLAKIQECADLKPDCVG